jgi:hypothetical protein
MQGLGFGNGNELAVAAFQCFEDFGNVLLNCHDIRKKKGILLWLTK